MNAILRVLMMLPVPAMVLFKMTILLGLGWAVHFAQIRSNPRWRALLWRMVMVCLVLLIPAQLFLPELPLFVIKEAPIKSAPANLALAPLPVAPIELQTPAEPLVQPDNTLSPIPQKPQISIAALLDSLTRNWPALLAMAWVAIALLLSARYIHTYSRLGRFIKNTEPAPESILATARQVASQLERVEMPRLRVAADLASPFAAGLLRPVIVIPKTLANEKYRPNLVAVLAHELVHIKSRDLFWMAFGKALSILLWFHPLVWRMRHAHNMACEQVCDGVAAEISGGAPAYSQTLAQTFLTLVVDAPQPMGAPMLRPSEIMRRIAILKIGRQVKSLRRSWIGLACLAAVIVLAGLGGLRLAEAKDTAQTAINAHNYSLADILAGIAAHEAQIQSAEFDLTCEILPSDRHPEVPNHFKYLDFHYIWNSGFNIWLKGKVQTMSRSNRDASGKSTVFASWSEEISWDHKQAVVLKSDTNEAFIEGDKPRGIFYFYFTPMGALGYCTAELANDELTLQKTLAKYGASFANPPTEVIGDKEVYVIETSFSNNPKNPLEGERVHKFRFYICPALQFSPLKIEMIHGTDLVRRNMIEYTTVDGIVIPAVNRGNVWFPSGPQKGLEMTAPKEIRFSNILLNRSSPKTVTIPNGVNIYDNINGKSVPRRNRQAGSEGEVNLGKPPTSTTRPVDNTTTTLTSGPMPQGTSSMDLAWGGARNGVQLGAAAVLASQSFASIIHEWHWVESNPQKGVWQPGAGEPVMIRYSLQNNGNKPIRFYGAPACGEISGPAIGWGGGGIRLIAPDAKQIYANRTGLLSEGIDIAPGTMYSGKANLSRYFDFPKPGTYHVTLTLLVYPTSDPSGKSGFSVSSEEFSLTLSDSVSKADSVTGDRTLDNKSTSPTADSPPTQTSSTALQANSQPTVEVKVTDESADGIAGTMIAGTLH